MPRDLEHLIKASGNAGTSGQSFRNHVTGAVSGAKMTDYNIDDWHFAGDFPNQVDDPYDDLRVFEIDLSFTQGTRAGNIKRTGDVVSIAPSGSSGVEDSSGVSSVVSGNSGSTIDLTMRAPFRSNQTGTGTADWTGGGGTPPDSDPHDVTFEFVVTPGDAGSEMVSVNLTYIPDIGPYNATLQQLYEFLMNKRSRTPSDFDIEWHTNSSFTDLHSTNPSFIISSSPGDPTVTYWVRARTPADAPNWPITDQVDWTDPRDGA